MGSWLPCVLGVKFLAMRQGSRVLPVKMKGPLRYIEEAGPVVWTPCRVPRSRWKVHGASMEGVVPKPAAWSRAHTVRAQGERMTVCPPTSIIASQWMMVGGTPVAAS